MLEARKSARRAFNNPPNPPAGTGNRLVLLGWVTGGPPVTHPRSTKSSSQIRDGAREGSGVVDHELVAGALDAHDAAAAGPVDRARELPRDVHGQAWIHPVGVAVDEGRSKR